MDGEAETYADSAFDFLGNKEEPLSIRKGKLPKKEPFGPHHGIMKNDRTRRGNDDG